MIHLLNVLSKGRLLVGVILAKQNEKGVSLANVNFHTNIRKHSMTVTNTAFVEITICVSNLLDYAKCGPGLWVGVACPKMCFPGQIH